MAFTRQKSPITHHPSPITPTVPPAAAHHPPPRRPAQLAPATAKKNVWADKRSLAALAAKTFGIIGTSLPPNAHAQTATPTPAATHLSHPPLPHCNHSEHGVRHVQEHVGARQPQRRVAHHLLISCILPRHVERRRTAAAVVQQAATAAAVQQGGAGGGDARGRACCPEQ